MSDFIMGARLELTDDFSTTMSAATTATQQFRNSLGNVDDISSAAATGIDQVTQSINPMLDAMEEVASASEGIQEAADAVQDMVQPTAEAAANMNRWQAAMSSFDNGVATIRQLPSTLKQIATTKLDGLKNSFTSAKTKASELVTSVKTLASTKVSSLVSSFNTFRSTVSEGRTGLSGLTTSIKNVGKISISSTVSGFKNLVTQGKNFVGLKISQMGQKISALGGPAGIAKAAFSAMAKGLKTVASLSLKGLVTGLKTVGSVAKDAAAKIASGIGNTAITAVKGLTAALGAAATAVGGIVTASINIGKEFEAGMSGVAAISGATGEDFEALKAKAMEMGASTAFSATEAASAMEYMAMAGWKTEDMISGIEGIMNLAAASGADLATTSDIVTDALTAFGMTAAESGRFSDVMAAASSNANTNVELMGETFKYVGAAAGAMGYSIEDMAVATGLMANAGIKGSQAGTALRSTITRMAKPTKESQEAMDALGISLTDSQGNMKEFSEIMAEMRAGMSSMTEDQKASYAAMLGGQEAMSGLLAIANASDEDFNKLTEAINNSAGAAQEMAAVKLDNLQGDIENLMGGLETMGIMIYDTLQPSLRGIVQEAGGMVDSLTTAFQEGGFDGLVSEVGNVLATVVTRVAEYAPQVIDMGISIVDNLLTGIQNNAPAIGQGAASTIASFVGGIVKLFPKLILTGITLLTEFITGMVEQFPEMLATGKSTVSEFVTGLQDSLPKLVAAGGELLGLLAQTLISELPRMIDSGASSIASFINGIAGMLPSIINTAIQLITTLVSGIAANLPQIITAAVNLVLTLAQGIITMLPTIVQSALQLVLSLVQGLIANLPMIITAAVQLVTSLISGIVTMLPEIINAAIQLITSLVQGLIENLPQILTAAIEIVFALINGLIQAIPDLIMAVPQLISAIIDTIMGTDWLEVGGNIISGIGSGLIEGVKSIGSSIKDACSGIKDSICDFFGIHSPSRLMNDMVGTNMALGISEGFQATMAASADTMANAVPSDFSTSTTLAVNADTSAIDAIGGTTSTVAFTSEDNIPTATYGNTPVNAAGVTNNSQTSKSQLHITIEKILLEGVGDKDPKELVNEIIAALYERLSGADEVLSDGELGALL